MQTKKPMDPGLSEINTLSSEIHTLRSTIEYLERLIEEKEELMEIKDQRIKDFQIILGLPSDKMKANRLKVVYKAP